MSDTTDFADFIRRVRAGDGQAAEELVRKYEPLIRREVRLRLEDGRLGRVFDSMDVCQSVLRSFFVRTAAGEYDLQEPAHLVRLLATMARNKVASVAREQQRQKRDNRRVGGGDEALGGVAGAEPTPSRVAVNKDLLAAVRARLTEEERQLSDLRAQGLSWEEIAAQVGGKAQARRVQFSRALSRVVQELKLDESRKQ